MNLVNNLRSLYTRVQNRADLQSQRERILFNLLVGMSVLGLLLLGVYSNLAIREQRWLTLAIFSVIYLWTLSVTIFKSLPYLVRAGSLLSIIYALGLITLFQDGLQGNARVYLFGFTIITGILLGIRGGAAALTLSVSTLIAGYYLFRANVVELPPINPTDLDNFPFWAVAVTAFTVTGVITTISVVFLLKSLETSLHKEKALADALEKEHDALEINIQERTQDLERRIRQIHTTAEITRVINALLEPQDLLQKVVDLLKERFDLYYAGVFLLDSTGEFAVLKAGTGDAGKRMIAEGHRLAVGGASMIGWTTANKQARIALDVGAEAVRFSNPHLPLTRSELALPMIVGDRILGALTVQSSLPEAFDQNDITILQGMADGLATALENARLYTQSQANLHDIQTLHHQYLVKAWKDITASEQELQYTFENAEQLDPEISENVAVPITLRGQVIGQLQLEGQKAPLSPEEMMYVEAITSEAAAALENVRLLGETQRLAEKERMVSEIAVKIRSSTNVDTVLQTTLQEAARALRATGGSITLDAGIQEVDQPGGNGPSRIES
jgi:GAF domain-containing protein